MHPILRRPGKLALYLLAWIPLGAITAAMLAAGGHVPPARATAVALPLSLVNAFVCLSAYYVCRYPVSSSRVWRLYLTPLAASLVGGGIFVAAAEFISGVLDGFTGTQDFGALIAGQRGVLFGLGSLFFLLSIAIHHLLLTAEASAVAEREAAEARALAKEAELKALKAQINPHFLFNSLNSVAALTSMDPARARDMCVLLGDFLRSSLKLADVPSISLEQELSLIRNFLAIEKVRFGERLSVEEQVGENCLGCTVPSLLLQPLIENAVKHGIADLVDGGTIRIEARNSGARLRLAVENDFDPESVSLSKGGYGLGNVKRRLSARYGEDAEFDVRKENGRFRVEIVLPVRTES